MATVATQLNSGSGFASGEIVTATKLNNLVNTATVTGIVNADIDAAAAIAGSKLASGAITDTQLATGAVTGAAGGGKLAASAITGQTTIADPLADTDEFLVHDASASALRKVAYSNIAPTVTASKLDGVAKDNGGANLSAGTAPIFGCRAWVNFDTTRDSSGASNTSNTNRFIRAGGNVASVLKNGVGDYTITFTTAMPDANYAVVGSASYTYPAGAVLDVVVPFYSTAPTTTAVRIATGQGGTVRDNENVVVSVFR